MDRNDTIKRISGMKKRMLAECPTELLPERALLVTEAYKKYASEPPVLKRAYALRHILEATGSAAAASWMIGDNWTDIDSGHAAGFRTAYCAWGYGAPDRIQPDAICASMDAVKRAVIDANK